MANPVLVQLLRGGAVESSHRGAVAIADTRGSLVLSLGDVSENVYPRSVVKPFQALPLVESGAVDRFGLGADDLAVICGSHSGEPGHIEVVERILRRINLDATALKCGPHLPLNEQSAQAMMRLGVSPTALHNNCSGKHAGFLCVACDLEANIQDYVSVRHPVQREVKNAIESLTGASLSDARSAIDGCSVPTWLISLTELAIGFARFVTGDTLAPERAKAVRRLRAACTENSWNFAGTERFCTEMLKYFGSSVFIKVGAEGVYGLAFPQLGLGAAIKCDDGAWRASSVVAATLISRAVTSYDLEHPVLAKYLEPTQHNWNGLAVGKLRPTAELLSVRF